MIHEHHLDFSRSYICAITRDIAHLRIRVFETKRCGAVKYGISMQGLCGARVMRCTIYVPIRYIILHCTSENNLTCYFQEEVKNLQMFTNDDGR